MQEIITGYRIGGRTWISSAWNAGTLTRQDILDAITSYAEENDVPDEDEIRAIEEEYVLDDVGEDATPEEIERQLNECVERRMASIEAEKDEKQAVVEALQQLYDEWNDDKNDESQFHLVYQAHAALDDYCRKITYGEFDC